MNPAPWSLPTTASAFARGWQMFFHDPCDARVCAAIRIVFSALVLIHLAILYPDLDRWFTEEGVLPVANAREIASPHTWSLFWHLPGTSAVIHVCYWIAVGNAALLLIGFLSPLNALWVFIWVVSFQNRNQVLNDGQDSVMKMIGFFLIWMPSGRCWSVDALIRRWWRSWRCGLATGGTDRLGSAWALRLLQIEMVLIMLSTGLVKLAGESWVNGTALYYVSRLDDHFGRFPVPAWVFDSPWVVALLTWSVLLAELAVPIFIWFRETRWICLITVILFHLGNEWTMNLFLFHWLMLCGWMAFVTPNDFRWRALGTVGDSLRGVPHDPRQAAA